MAPTPPHLTHQTWVPLYRYSASRTCVSVAPYTRPAPSGVLVVRASVPHITQLRCGGRGRVAPRSISITGFVMKKALTPGQRPQLAECSTARRCMRVRFTVQRVASRQRMHPAGRALAACLSCEARPKPRRCRAVAGRRVLGGTPR